MEAVKQIAKQKYEITHEQLKAMYDAIALSDDLSKKHLENLKKLAKLYKLSCQLSAFSLDILDRIKERYPFIWNECTSDGDQDFIFNLIEQLDKK